MLYEATCNVCGEKVKPAETKGQLARNLGLHKLSKHGIHGRQGGGGYIPVAMRPGHPKYAGPGATPEQLATLEKARLARQEERKRAKAKELASKAFPLALDKCPKCEGEFLRRAKGRTESIKLTQCEACKIRFYFTNYVDSAPSPTLQ